MRINYNVTGNERKALVKVISEATGEKAVYKFTPTYAFEIGEFTVTRYGALEFDDSVDGTAVIAALESAGYTGEAEATEEAADQTEQTADAEDTGDEDTEETTEYLASPDGLTIEMPRNFYTDAALDNLQKVVDSKASLIKKALGANALPIQIGDEKVSFPWFTETDADSVHAYTAFISKLSKMAKNATRVTAADRMVDNEKYAFRCFLLRLGFIGADYKTDRKILLKNLTGSSAFKSGQRKDGGDDEISE